MATSQVEQLTITIPSEIAEAVKAKVVSGEFSTEGEALSTSFVHYLSEHSDSLLELGDQAFDQMLQREVIPILEELEALPSAGRNIKQMRAKIMERRSR